MFYNGSWCKGCGKELIGGSLDVDSIDTSAGGFGKGYERSM